MSAEKVESRQRRKARIRKKVVGTTERPRLTVFRSLTHIYAQVIDDSVGQTLAEASTITPEVKGALGELDKTGAAKLVGKVLGERCKAKNISRVVFDRNGLAYHGRIAAVATGAREAGLEF